MRSAALTGGKAIDAGVEIDVLGDGQVLVEAELLRHVTDMAADLRCVFTDIHAENATGAFGWRKQAAKRLDDRGFPGAVWSKETEELAYVDLKADVADSCE